MADMATVRRLHADGLSQRAIGDAIGISDDAVGRLLRQHGIEAHPRSRAKSQTRIEVDEAGGVVRLHLLHGLVGLIDIADRQLLDGWAWWADRKANGICYVLGHLKSDLSVRAYLHQRVLPTPPGYQPDHINRNGLDNRRSNLRIATPQQNKANQAKPALGRAVSSRFKGVTLNRSYGKKWIATIVVSGVRRRKFCATEEAAALAYDAMAREAHGDFAVLNFPGPFPVVDIPRTWLPMFRVRDRYWSDVVRPVVHPENRQEA